MTSSGSKTGDVDLHHCVHRTIVIRDLPDMVKKACLLEIALGASLADLCGICDH